MAEFSIDQNKLPGVKEVVRDFAVLEDHCLAHNLQEQEIESHLASNVHKSRLVQQDVALAKQLQEEEDRRAKAKAHRQHRDIERSDNEIAQEIQEELVRQAKQQRMQEEKDAAIARKLQEKERKEERKRQKQLEANFEEEYYEDNGRIVQGGPGNYGLGEATQGITKLDLREQELLDMEVARKLQEEEVKASKMDKRAAQVAQDEEIARLLMEREKMEYKKSREKEKQGMRPEERRRPEGGDYKPSSEEVVHPRLREEEYQKPRNHQKPARCWPHSVISLPGLLNLLPITMRMWSPATQGATILPGLQRDLRRLTKVSITDSDRGFLNHPSEFLFVFFFHCCIFKTPITFYWPRALEQCT
ncbi:coiled-coil domain-containing protein 50 isoform X3 [Oncorhynchus tshawytscha]|uniref:coiled-coil domain-containing protein 50 isoform X3 n=1 Tax=Oncorhynchus tshawytscha TaxID=74940 RepID=UPI001C3DC508|nr:coiled-coil domain-containing protein 50 isoform X3 [Oncorhynchus tshawytscha]